LSKKHEEVVSKHVGALTYEEKRVAVREVLDSLSADEKTKLALEAMAAALQAMQEERAKSELEKEQLQIQLDESLTWCTLKRFNFEHSLGFIPKELNAQSKALGLMGKERKKVSDANYSSGVWAYRISDLEAYYEGLI
jgi:hypothetical protein